MSIILVLLFFTHNCFSLECVSSGLLCRTRSSNPTNYYIEPFYFAKPTPPPGNLSLVSIMIMEISLSSRCFIISCSWSRKNLHLDVIDMTSCTETNHRLLTNSHQTILICPFSDSCADLSVTPMRPVLWFCELTLYTFFGCWR